MWVGVVENARSGRELVFLPASPAGEVMRPSKLCDLICSSELVAMKTEMVHYLVFLAISYVCRVSGPARV